MKKTCKQCLKNKDVSRFSVTDKHYGYIKNICKKCFNSNRRSKYKVDPEFRKRFKEYNKATYQRRKDKHAAYSKAYRLANADKLRAARKSKYYKNPEENKSRARKWYADNKARCAANVIKWRKNNIQKKNEYEARRRAAKKTGVHTVNVDRDKIIERDKSTCYLCGKKELKGFDLTLDHVIPLAKGGKHVEKNLRVACRSCNSRKCDKIVHL